MPLSCKLMTKLCLTSLSLSNWQYNVASCRKVKHSLLHFSTLQSQLQHVTCTHVLDNLLCNTNVAIKVKSLSNLFINTMIQSKKAEGNNHCPCLLDISQQLATFCHLQHCIAKKFPPVTQPK